MRGGDGGDSLIRKEVKFLPDLRDVPHCGRFNSGHAHQRRKPVLRPAGADNPAAVCSASDSGKDCTVPGGDQRREMRDGFRTVRLVMSINNLRM